MQDPSTNTNDSRETKSSLEEIPQTLNGNSVNGSVLNGNVLNGNSVNGSTSNGKSSAFGGASENFSPVSMNGSASSINGENSYGKVNGKSVQGIKTTHLDPFGEKNFKFSLDVPRNVVVRVVDIFGIDAEAGLLVDELRMPGNYIVKLNKGNNNSGIYFYKLYIEIDDEDMTVFETLPDKPGRKYRLVEMKEVFI